MSARSAYYTAFHAAKAFIFEKTGRVANTRRGVRSEFARLAKDDGRIAQTMATFLALAYEYNEIGDYVIDAKAAVTLENAEAAISRAADFLDCIEAILTDVSGR